MRFSRGKSKMPNAKVLIGDVRKRLLEIPDGSVRTCITSPPYFGLRSYLPDVVALKPNLTVEQRATVEAELARLGISPIAD